MSSVTAVPIQPVKRRYLVYLVLGLVLAIASAVALAWQTGMASTTSGLRYEIIKQGTGPSPTDTDVALVSYVGRLSDGTEFDRSQQPTPMPVAGVVPGFSEGLKLMPKGSKYRFWVKPSLGYGAKGAGPIPPNALLVFDVELLDFLPEAYIRQLQMQQQMQGGAVPGGPAVAPGGR